MLKSAWIIESFAPEETHIGEALAAYLRRNGVEAEYRSPKTLEELQAVFAEIKSALVDPNKSPLAVQFVCHGCDRGIFLESKLLVEWELLRQGLRDIYVASKQRFHLLMGSCRGFSAARLIAKREPCPFSAIYGTSQTIGRISARDCYIHMYDSILAGKSPAEVAHSANISFSCKMLGYNTHELWNIAASNYLDSLSEEGVANKLAEALARNREAILRDQNVEILLRQKYTRSALIDRLVAWEKTFKS
jgi:hypothetical protein